MMRWCITCRGTGWPLASTRSTRNPRNQPSIGQSKCCTGVSCDRPMSIIAWLSIGGMFGRAYGPAVMVSSCLDESIATLTGAGRAPGPGPARVEAARVILHSILRLHDEGGDGRIGIAPLPAVGQVTRVQRNQSRPAPRKHGRKL